MAESLEEKGKKSRGKPKKATITKLRRKSRSTGVSVKDLVGTIKLNVDPVEFQRSIRDEWA